MCQQILKFLCLNLQRIQKFFQDSFIVFAFIWLVVILVSIYHNFPERMMKNNSTEKSELVEALGLYLLGIYIAPLGLYLTHKRTEVVKEADRSIPDANQK